MQSNKHWKPVNKVTVLSPELLIADIQLKKKKKKGLPDPSIQSINKPCLSTNPVNSLKTSLNSSHFGFSTTTLIQALIRMTS